VAGRWFGSPHRGPAGGGGRRSRSQGVKESFGFALAKRAGTRKSWRQLCIQKGEPSSLTGCNCLVDPIGRNGSGGGGASEFRYIGASRRPAPRRPPLIECPCQGFSFFLSFFLSFFSPRHRRGSLLLMEFLQPNQS
jgi:hypothetical protein